ncbi:hypothetical protein Scep_012814 [Stephania cephalantha]|uniref:Uncharacterized protein n=1 Tax=Stephania cephalantha TaxID=152367 RepID=A0AAP0PA75_9MAGN
MTVSGSGGERAWPWRDRERSGVPHGFVREGREFVTVERAALKAKKRKQPEAKKAKAIRSEATCARAKKRISPSEEAKQWA